jgi:hypothetical protein
MAMSFRDIALIRSFRGKFAEAILVQRRAPKGFPADLLKVARRKLVQLNGAEALGDLAVLLAICLRLSRAIYEENIRSASTINGGLFSNGLMSGRRMLRLSIIIKV